VDIVTVIHNNFNKKLSIELEEKLLEYETEINFIVHSNMENNLGFAKGCNLGASLGNSDIIGFLNPDVIVNGNFSSTVKKVLSKEIIVITGNRFGKSDRELKIWGVKDWVCGASFFVKRSFFESVGGFDEGYVWSWEETDLIRQAESKGFSVRSVDLPIQHTSPTENSIKDSEYKQKYFNLGSQRFYNKWGATNAF